MTILDALGQKETAPASRGTALRPVKLSVSASCSRHRLNAGHCHLFPTPKVIAEGRRRSTLH
jgi:hypothetical protein